MYRGKNSEYTAGAVPLVPNEQIMAVYATPKGKGLVNFEHVWKIHQTILTNYNVILWLRKLTGSTYTHIPISDIGKITLKAGLFSSSVSMFLKTGWTQQLFDLNKKDAEHFVSQLEHLLANEKTYHPSNPQISNSSNSQISNSSNSQPSNSLKKDDPLHILNTRLASGEISIDEYSQLKKILLSPASTPKTKNIGKCQNCGAKLYATDVFCSNCGMSRK